MCAGAHKDLTNMCEQLADDDTLVLTWAFTPSAFLAEKAVDKKADLRSFSRRTAAKKKSRENDKKRAVFTKFSR